VSRLQALLARLGTAGVLGLGVLFFCVPFYLSALRPAEQELTAQREAAERLRGRGPFRPVAVDDRADDLRRFYGLLPPVESLTDQLETVYALARAAKLELMQGEYRLEKRNAGPVAYRITLPVRGSYAQVRAFLDTVLRQMPLASVDALRFERKKIADPQLDAQIRLTLHFRPGDDAETR
jgi:hypothetical protein